MQNAQETKNSTSSQEGATQSIGSRGGNDMISGAENWDDIELRIDDERAKIGEQDEAVRTVGNGQLDPSDEHAFAPICPPLCDPSDDLIRMMGQMLNSLEVFEKYCSDADARDDKDLLAFFREVRQDEKMRLAKARHLFSSRFATQNKENNDATRR